MAGQVQICNMALLELGANLIGAISEETREAQACRTYWDTAYDEFLSEGEYNYAMVRTATLATHPAGDPAGEWSIAYNLPNDPYCIRVQYPVLQRGDSKWRVNGRILYTDQEVQGLIYVGRVELAEMPAVVANALSYYLAWRMAYALTESSGRKRDLFQYYQAARAEAQKLQGFEGNWDHTQAYTLASARWARGGGLG